MSSNPKSRWEISTISNVTLLLPYLVGAVALVALVNVNTKQQALRNAELYSSMILDRNVVTHSFFNIVNDTLGHAAGDDFLSVIAKRLRESSRQADTVARLGDDEFVWFGEIDDEEDIRRITGKFLEGIAQPGKWAKEEPGRYILSNGIT